MYYDIEESGKRIQELRKQKGLTQAGLAEMIGVTPNSIARIEKGIMGAKIDTLVAIADYYQTTLDYLVAGVEYKTKIDLNLSISDLTEEQRQKLIELCMSN